MTRLSAIGVGMGLGLAGVTACGGSGGSHSQAARTHLPIRPGASNDFLAAVVPLLKRIR
jgi:hypothetical protein